MQQTSPADALTDLEIARTFWRPILLLPPDRMVHPPSWLEHVPFAFWLMDVLRPRVFVELGSHTGNSYCALAQAAQHLGLRSAGYAVDTWAGDAQAGFYAESVYEELKSYHDRRYSAFSRLVRSTFDEALEHFDDGTVDLLNIDGYHVFEAVRHDLDTWLPKMSGRGVVLMHDINVRERDFGAWKVWDRVKAAYPSVEFLHGHGLGLLAVGGDLPEALCDLTAAARDERKAAAIQRFFAHAGAGVLAQYEARQAAADRRARLDAERALQEQMHTRQAEAAAHAAVISDLERRVREQAAALDDHALERQRLLDAESSLATRLAETTRDIDGLRRATGEERARNDAARQAARVRTGLAEVALAEARLRLGQVASRLRSLSGSLAATRAAGGGRFVSIWSTLRALGITPRWLARHPRRLAMWLRLVLGPRLFAQARLLTRSGLFDASYYTARYPDVAGTGANPLWHYLLTGAREGRAPNRLFDAAWYLAANPDVARIGANPLVHYLRRGAAEGRDPHPLFDGRWYLSRLGETTPVNPLQHYLTSGWLEGRSPHPLFDAGFYVETAGARASAFDPLVHFLAEGADQDCNPHPLFDLRTYRQAATDLESSGLNPLVHYLQSGSGRGLRPHPLFDPAYYRATYPDVVAAGAEALVHFVTAGAPEGRRPVPEFDTAWYLATYGDVAQSGANALVHYATAGWLEGRQPSPDFDGLAYLRRYPDVLRDGVNPLMHYVQFGRAEGRSAAAEPTASFDEPPVVDLRPINLGDQPDVSAPGSARTVVCLTHVLPVHPRAGNEYRIHRMLRWLSRSGYRVVPIVAPNDGTRPTASEVRATADAFGNAIVCHADGEVAYVLRNVTDVLKRLRRTTSRAVPGEQGPLTDQAHRLLQMDRAFCTDVLIEVVLALQPVLGPSALLAEYIWMSRVLPLVGPGTLRLLDTIDVFSSRAEKVDQYGVSDLTVPADAERARLLRADVLIAIQDNERAALQRLAPERPIITCGVDFDVTATAPTPAGRAVLCVASGNPMNRRGIRDFLRFAWPRIRARLPDARLLVAGAVGEAIPLPPDGVDVRGRVEDLEPLYRSARVVINPAVAGTGVKIKTLEALAHLRPVVTWPNGVDGLSPAVASLCDVVEDWFAFGEAVAARLDDAAGGGLHPGGPDLLAREADADRVYADLGRVLEDHFTRALDQH